VKEEAILLGESATLVGVVTDPPGSARQAGRHGVVLLNAGLVHRVGPGRLYVKLARRLATHGFVVVRFDYSGIGDSPARSDHLPVEQSGVSETVEAMDFLARTRGVESFSLVGLCSGAIFSFRTALHDPRVAGISLLNARGFDRSTNWRRDVESRIWVRHYLDLAAKPVSWWRAVTGQSNYRRLARIVGARAASFLAARKEVKRVAGRLAADMKQLLERGVFVLWVSSDDDPSLEYLATIEREGEGDLLSSRVELSLVQGADHTFTRSADLEEVINAVDSWMVRRWPAADREASVRAATA
jgi:pimeloyl-ACP methyl ester carboxylesterase